MTVFGDRAFKKVIKLIIRSLGWVLFQSAWPPCEKRGLRHRGKTVKTQGERGGPFANRGEASEESSPGDTLILDFELSK